MDEAALFPGADTLTLAEFYIEHQALAIEWKAIANLVLHFACGGVRQLFDGEGNCSERNAGRGHPIVIGKGEDAQLSWYTKALGMRACQYSAACRFA